MVTVELQSISRPGTAPTHLRRVPVRLNLKSPVSSHNSPRSLWALRRTGPSPSSGERTATNRMLMKMKVLPSPRSGNREIPNHDCGWKEHVSTTRQHQQLSAESATMTCTGQTPFPRFLDMACGQCQRSHTLHPGSAFASAARASGASITVATSCQQFVSDPLFIPRPGTPPTPLRRVPARLTKSTEELRQIPLSPTSPKRPGALRQTDPSTSPLVLPVQSKMPQRI
jgi:hypothetical protein